MSSVKFAVYRQQLPVLNGFCSIILAGLSWLPGNEETLQEVTGPEQEILWHITLVKP